MIDIHCHLLPAIDDGADTPEQSAQVMEALAADGVVGLVLTPHVSAEEIDTDPEDPLERRDMAMTMLRPRAPAAPHLHLGFEIMLERDLPDRAFRHGEFSLAGSRYYLVEFPPNASSAHIRQGIAGVVRRGAVPIVAHPERYRVCSVTEVAGWRAEGAKLQVDATTISRATTRGKRARALLYRGLVDVMAADNHGDSRTLKTGVVYLEGRGAVEHAALLASVNPEAIVQDRDLTAVPAVPSHEGLLHRLFRQSRR